MSKKIKKKKKGFLATIWESLTKTGGCCGSGESCCSEKEEDQLRLLKKGRSKMNRRNFLKAAAVGGCISPLMGNGEDEKVERVNTSEGNILFKYSEENTPVLTSAKDAWESSMTDCLIWGREDESQGRKGPMFYLHDGVIACNLDRYIIMPVEKFNEMMGEKIEDIKFS